ncbi:MAG: hypothetical protein OXI44_05930 [Bacteroidota bacterium]|nr:hypothetical protein [Bacteroidota bacterium]
MKMKYMRFTAKFALVIALAILGYLGGAATVAVDTLAAEEEARCERDKCVRGSDDATGYVYMTCEDRWWPFGESRQTNCSMNGDVCETTACK